jgi:putative transposase
MALRLIESNDPIACEDLNVKGLASNRRLVKSIGNLARSLLRRWLKYFRLKSGKVAAAVAPHHIRPDRANSGPIVRKSRSTRTHVFPHSGCIEDKEIEAAPNILHGG